MTKNEFLEGLRKALGNDLDRETVRKMLHIMMGISVFK